MENNNIIDYVMKTPENTNPAILNQMLDQLKGSGAEKACVVSFIYNQQEDNWNIDKLAPEIYEAYTNGQLILAKYNNGSPVFTLSAIHRVEVTDIAAGAYRYIIWFSSVVGENVFQLQYIYDPTGMEDSEVVYETFVEYTEQLISSSSTSPRRVSFETDGSSYISQDDFDAIKAALDDGTDIYAVLDGYERYTFNTIERDSEADAATIYFTYVDAIGSSVIFKTIAWHHESGAEDRITLTTKTLAAQE